MFILWMNTITVVRIRTTAFATSTDVILRYMPVLGLITEGSLFPKSFQLFSCRLVPVYTYIETSVDIPTYRAQVASVRFK